MADKILLSPGIQRWKKIGGGSLRWKGQILKQNQIFEAYEAEIPTSARKFIIKLPPEFITIDDENCEKLPPKDPSDMVCDIIVPTYNNEKYTIACFESIKKNTRKGSYRLIWVDNGSKDLSKVAKVVEDMHCTSIRCSQNLGFVSAINIGLSASDGDAVCFLNNDTEVSKGWLDKLLQSLYRDTTIGIICPLTGPPAIEEQYDSHHNIAYQQRFRKVPIFPTWKGLDDFNTKIEKQLPGMVSDIEFAAFLCAVIKREVINKVGHLDAAYAMGMWDDADYNYSIVKAGYEKKILLDTCIIHHGRATFNIVEKEEGLDIPALLAKNRAILNKKWGC